MQLAFILFTIFIFEIYSVEGRIIYWFLINFVPIVLWAEKILLDECHKEILSDFIPNALIDFS